MSDAQPPRHRRDRLDAGARDRLMQEILRIESAGRAAPRAALPAPRDEDRVWGNLRNFAVDAALLDRNLVITAARNDPAHASFDVLRARLVQALADRGWRSVAVTSPSKAAGKSFTVANLAIALSRYDMSRTIVMDMDLRRPALARYFGLSAPPVMGEFLRDRVPTQDFLLRPGQNLLNIGTNIAFGFNARPESFASELFHDPATARVLARMIDETAPDIVLYDLPPALAQDDVIAFRPHFDCVLMVAGGGTTTARDLKEAVRRIGDDKPVIGVVLNKGDTTVDYYY